MEFLAYARFAARKTSARHETGSCLAKRGWKRTHRQRRRQSDDTARRIDGADARVSAEVRIPSLRGESGSTLRRDNELAARDRRGGNGELHRVDEERLLDYVDIL